ncbi:MAG: hypothetical protein QOI55_704 [Actinomycetota bacterium]|nr:hypothetical protein [Actinomycetota bacterium]
MGDASMTTVETMRKVLGETQRVVDGIEPSQLGRATPCAEWDVRAVLNHVTGGADMFATCVDEGGISDQRLVELVSGDNLGDDYRSSFEAAAKRAMTAFESPGAADKMVKLPFGEMPAGIAMQIAIFDVAVHALDLAKGSGQSTALDPQVLAAALESGRQMIGPEMRGTGLFDSEVPVAENAPLQDQLAAFAGRQP